MGNKQFGNIHLVEEIKSGKKKTAYIIRKEKISNKNLTENNISVLLEIDHINLTKIYDIFEDYNFIYIIREYCSGGTLLSFLLKNKCCNENLVKIIIKQLLNAVNYLHSLNPPIILGDIELTHIYIYQEEENLNNIIVKIADFPNAFIGKGLGESDKHYFVPPEIIKGNPKTIKSDTWSIGAIAYTLLAGEPPYDGKEHEIIYKVFYILIRLLIMI
jgi:serine/threonine protein kinase